MQKRSTQMFQRSGTRGIMREGYPGNPPNSTTGPRPEGQASTRHPRAGYSSEVGIARHVWGPRLHPQQVKNYTRDTGWALGIGAVVGTPKADVEAGLGGVPGPQVVQLSVCMSHGLANLDQGYNATLWVGSISAHQETSLHSTSTLLLVCSHLPGLTLPPRKLGLVPSL